MLFPLNRGWNIRRWFPSLWKSRWFMAVSLNEQRAPANDWSFCVEHPIKDPFNGTKRRIKTKERVISNSSSRTNALLSHQPQIEQKLVTSEKKLFITQPLCRLVWDMAKEEARVGHFCFCHEWQILLPKALLVATNPDRTRQCVKSRGKTGFWVGGAQQQWVRDPGTLRGEIWRRRR